ncbi:hypothetical protein [Bifidobacterium longum]|uniref:Serine/threonine protein kinase n=1 Tax=Bifidobacterium longum subsp. longum TaxID=1679 RepID=A0A4R0UL20_BIFLL|nr:serine/threonine protein kinase [Bifidobacterium longum subsp. longum]
MAGSDPAPGSSVSSGTDITLYEGVDADSVNDLMISKITGFNTINELNTAVVGTYCKATIADASKDCMTLSAGPNSYGDPIVYQEWGGTPSDSPADKDRVNQCFASNGGDVGRCTISGEGVGSSGGGASDRLITKNWGMFDQDGGQAKQGGWRPPVVGAWGTVMKVNKDGTFSGSYHDSDMGATGDGYLIGNDVDTLNGKALLNVTSGADKGYTFYDFS